MSSDQPTDEIFEGLAAKLRAVDLTDIEREVLDLIVVRAASADDVSGFMFRNPDVVRGARQDDPRTGFDKVMKPDGTSVPGLSLDGLKLGAGFSLG